MKKLFLLFYNFIENYVHLRRIKKFLMNNIFFKNPVIFDIGSHQGKIATLMNHIYKNAKIYCFEPNKFMNKNLKKIGKNIRICNYAIGDKVANKKITINKIDLTNTLSQINNKSLYLKIKNFIINKSKKKDEYKKIKMVSLKYFCKKNKIKHIDFLKIDVEGYEYKVLLGAKEIINKVKYIMIEVQKNDMYKGYSAKKIENYLRKHNFKLIKKFNFPFMFFQDKIYKKI